MSFEPGAQTHKFFCESLYIKITAWRPKEISPHFPICLIRQLREELYVGERGGKACQEAFVLNFLKSRQNSV